MSNLIQPALVIGLGGSGIEIVRRFRRRFQEQYPNTPYVRFLGVDTEPQRERPDLPKLSDDEFLWAAEFEMPYFVGKDHIDRFPPIRAWWQGYDHITHGFISAGAGQRRPVGRLAFFVRYSQIKEALRRHVRSIYANESFTALPQQYKRAINIYIVSSTCGGTGTGMFLDFAYLARKVVPEVAPQAVPWVRGLLLMPSVFLGTGEVPPANRDALYANAYGALAELDYCMSTNVRRLPVEYADGPVRRDEQVFRSCFLLGNQDARGAIYHDINAIYERGATHLQIELASELKQTGEAVIDNVLARVGDIPEVQGRARLYSSFNGDWLELPSKRVITRWTKQCATGLVERLSAGASAEGRGPGAAASAELGRTDGYGKLRALFAPGGISSYMPKVDDYASDLQAVGSEGINASALQSKAAALQAEARRQIERGRLRENVRAALEQVASDVDAALGKVLTKGSIADGLQFVSKVRDELDRWLETSRENRHRPGRGWLADFNERVANVKPKGLLESKSAYTRRQIDAIAAALSEGEADWQREIWSQIADELQDPALLPLARRGLDQKREYLDRVSAWLPTVGTEISRISEPSMPAGMALESMSDEAIDDAIQDPEHLERVEQFLRQDIGTVLTGTTGDADALLKAIWHLCVHAVRPVAEDFLANTRIPAGEISARLNDLSPLAVFTARWRALEGTPQFPEPQRLWLIALPDHMGASKEEILSKLPPEHRDTQFVPTRGDDRVVMTTQHHGFPLFALAELTECRRAFDESDLRGRALRFTMPEAKEWQIEPLRPDEACQWFALALATGRVTRRGREYRYLSDSRSNGQVVDQLLDEGSEDPAESRRRARDAFVAAGLATDVRHRTLTEIDREGGNSALYARLIDWSEKQEAAAATDPAAFPGEFLADVNSVRKYAESIR